MEKVKSPQEFIPGRRYWLEETKRTNAEFVKLDNDGDSLFKDQSPDRYEVIQVGKNIGLITMYFDDEFELIP